MLVFASVFIVLWMFSFGGSISDKDSKEELANELKPFSALRSNIIDGYRSMSETPGLQVAE